MSNIHSEPTAPAGNRRVAQGLESRARILAAARKLFEQIGYAATSTEALLTATGLTRGALYHHFKDKKEVFAAVCEAVHADLVAAIDAATAGVDAPMAQLQAGSLAWIEAVSQPGPRQVLLIDAPSVLGATEWAALDARHGYQQLRVVVGDIVGAHARRTELEMDALAVTLNGAINALAHWRATHPGAAAYSALQQALSAACGAVAALPASVPTKSKRAVRP